MSARGTPRLIALDWGTSSLRAWLLGESGAVLDSRMEPLGIMRIPSGHFAAAFDAVTGAWLAAMPALPAIASGMIGSRQGWFEVPYVPCPAGLGQLAAALRATRVTEGVLHIVPGLIADRDTLPNVMRGEEAQIIGALAIEPALVDASCLILPGTHSKWASLERGTIVNFSTYMTGELYAVLRDHSILGRPVQAVSTSTPVSWTAFERGVTAARESRGGAFGALFSVRSLVLTGRLTPAQSVDYLSGLMIGEELRTALAANVALSRPFALIGEPALCERYLRAFAAFGISSPLIVADAAPAGLWRIACAAGLLSGSDRVGVDATT